MRTSELLNAVASWLDSDNEILLLAEHDDECLHTVAEACVKASLILKNAAKKTDQIEPESPTNITPENLEKLANLATKFDLSGDPELKKQASLIDELLLTVSASKEYLKQKKAEEDYKTKDLKKKYEDTKKQQDKNNKVEDTDKKLEDSEYLKQHKINAIALKSRYCPDHPGVNVIRLSDTAVQCSLDKKVYDFEAGFKLQDGTEVPGTNIQNQTKLDHFQQASLFNSREERLGENKG